MIKVGFVGIGNCCQTTVEGIQFYKDNPFAFGLIHPTIAGFQVSDIDIVWAADCDIRKVGKDLSEAIHAKPNCSRVLFNVPKLNVIVQNVPVMDGVSEDMLKVKNKNRTFVLSKDAPLTEEEIKKSLREAGVEILILFLPVGSVEATEFWARICCELKIHLINPIPIPIATDKAWAKKFKEAGIICAGDDAMAQEGATEAHRSVLQSCYTKGVRVVSTKQYNDGGNTDFKNMESEIRVQLKLISKLNSLVSIFPYPIKVLYAGPRKYISSRGDLKLAEMEVVGTGFGGNPITIKTTIETYDSPGSSAIVIDLIRIIKYAESLGYSGTLDEVCAFYMKNPPVPMNPYEAKESLERFLHMGSSWKIVMSSRIRSRAFSGDKFSEIFSEIAESIYEFGRLKNINVEMDSPVKGYCDRYEYCEVLRKATEKSNANDILFTIFCYEDVEDEIIEILKDYKGQIVAVNSPPSDKILEALQVPILYFGPDDEALGKKLAEEALRHSNSESRFIVVHHKENYRPFTLRNKGLYSVIDPSLVEYIYMEDLSNFKPSENDVFISYGNRPSEKVLEEFPENILIATDGTEKIKTDVEIDQYVQMYINHLKHAVG
ncbi:MAG: hypothetical protein PHG24_02640 [Candidatus Pacebacteria bacterium]|nr:hypothetical protein [Candidatus Paceibacterota bacterium]